MSLSVLERGETTGPAVGALPGRRSRHAETWLRGFRRRHRLAVAGLLLMLLCMQSVGMLSVASSGALLLVGGALIGIPHGSSDFVVARQAMAPRFGRAWLPCFLVIYLAAVAMVILGWHIAPIATFIAFLAISGFHFGAEEQEGDPRLRVFLARAATPVVPILLCHPIEVAGIIGVMCGQPAAAVAAHLAALRPTGLILYAALLIWVSFGSVGDAGESVGYAQRVPEILELVLLGLAAVLLPALVTFTVYFCLIHALRHMADLGSTLHPRDAGAALRLAALVVVPSALVCGVALIFAWSAIAGALTTTPLLAIALQITAALTVPHVLLEAWTHRQADTCSS